MSQEAIIKRLMKFLALARQGVGGEQANAQSVLEKLLKKHGLTLEDLEDNHAKRERHWFRPKSKQENMLLDAVVANTVRGWDRQVWGLKGRGQRRRGYDLTAAEAAQVGLAFDVHRKSMEAALQKALRNATIAYVHANGIFSLDDRNDESPSTLSEEDMEAIMSMMRGMRPTPVHRAITHHQK